MPVQAFVRQVLTYLSALENPVMNRELRSRMRGARSYVITSGYTAVVALCVLLVYWQLSFLESPQMVNQQAAAMGRAIWTWGCVVQALLVPFMVPAFTCGAITQERERDMLELLLLTRQTPTQICAGKLGSGIGLGMLLILTSVPVLSLTFVLGGVAPMELIACIAVLMATVLAAGALGLAASTLATKTSAASTASYATVGFALLGIPLLLYFAEQAQLLTQGGSEFGILAMLAAYMALTFAPGVGLAAFLIRIGSLRTGRNAVRQDWIIIGGLCWCALLATLYLPGANELLNNGGILLSLHPVAVILDAMGDQNVSSWIGGVSGIRWLVQPGGMWVFSVLISLMFAAWCFQIAVIRVRALRVG